ncbi:MAG: TOBE domain-containing protein, partial [Candidatus Rokuibacteriota bacterium]
PCGPRPGEPSLLMVRPEKIAIRAAGADRDGGLAGTVEDVVYVGEFTRYRVRVTPDVLIAVKTANTHETLRAKPGDVVRLRWAAADAYLVPPPD